MRRSHRGSQRFSRTRLATGKVRFVALLGLAAGLTAFDETSLGVLLPTLREDFQATATATHWVINAYLVVMASLVAASGRLADVVPVQHLWRLGLAIFLVTSLAAGFSPSIDLLIVLRAVQGLGAALIFTSSIVLIGRVFDDEERGRAFGIFSSLVTVLILLGPIAGGVLTEFLSWRWVFWVTVPPALLCLWRLRLPSPVAVHAQGAQGLDLPGMAALIVTIATLSLALMQGSGWGWGSARTLALFLTSIAAGSVFFWIESRAARPLIDLSLFRNRASAVALMTLFMAQYRRVGTSIFLALYFRDGLGFSPVTAGLALLPTVAVLPLTTVVIGRCADRFGARIVVLIGIAAVAVSVYWMAVASSLQSYWLLLPALLLVGCFAPAMFGPSRKAMLHAVPVDHHAQISGVSVTAQMLGSTLAISVGSVLLSMTGLSWSVFLVMALALTALWPVAYLWLEKETK